MKTLCITGTECAMFNKISDTIFNAGISPAKTITQPNGSSMDFNDWHQKVVDENSLLSIDSSSKIGRVWEQLAVDLFMENVGQEKWGWACPHSVKLLNFWHSFAPQLCFILLYSTPEEVIYAASKNLNNNSAHNNSGDAIIKQWLNDQQTMLNFYIKNPLQSLLINVNDFRKNPKYLVEKINEHFNFNLNSFTALNDPDSENLKTLEPNSLAEYLANITLKQSKYFSEVNNVFNELEKNKIIIVSNNDTNDNKLVENNNLAIDSYSLLCQYNQELQTAKDNLQAAVNNTKKLQTAKDNLQTAKDNLQAAFNNTKRENQNNKNILADLQDSKEEAELLLRQLHKVQEELEFYYLEYRAEKKRADTIESKWEKMLNKHPYYIDCDNIICQNSSDNQGLFWSLENIEIFNRSIDFLQLETLLWQDKIIFRFVEKQDKDLPLLVWNPNSKDNQNNNEFIVCPLIVNDAIQQLANTDIILLRNLSILFLQHLQQLLANNNSNINDTDDVVNNPNINTFINLFKQIPNFLDNVLPKTLRFDEFYISDNTNIGSEYESLTFHMTNINIGNTIHKKFEFRLSCANIQNGNFGTDPKLEFPEDFGKIILQNWFAESEDDSGKKLELRFAIPNAMDISVWNKLSQNDKIFIYNLVNLLPNRITQLSKINTNEKMFSRSFDDWINLANTIKNILNNNVLTKSK